MSAAALLIVVEQSGQELPSTAPGVHHEEAVSTSPVGLALREAPLRRSRTPRSAAGGSDLELSPARRDVLEQLLERFVPADPLQGRVVAIQEGVVDEAAFDGR